MKWEIYVSRSQHLQFAIINAAGMMIDNEQLQAQTGGNNYTIDVSGFSSGIYLLRIMCEDGSVKYREVCEAAMNLIFWNLEDPRIPEYFLIYTISLLQKS